MCVLAALPQAITPLATEATIAAAARRLLAEHGITRSWYYDVPALVLAGARTCCSISGRDYAPAEEPVGDTNLVTVDLSPDLDECWGDCARSFPVQGGALTTRPGDAEMVAGLETILDLHREMRAHVTPATTFHDLHAFASAWIAARGYECLDHRGNFGHSIVRRLSDRVYIEPGNHLRLIDADLFTFEPHLRAMRPGSRWGIKHENIYFFDARGRVEEL